MALSRLEPVLFHSSFPPLAFRDQILLQPLPKWRKCIGLTVPLVIKLAFVRRGNVDGKRMVGTGMTVKQRLSYSDSNNSDKAMLRATNKRECIWNLINSTGLLLQRDLPKVLSTDSCEVFVTCWCGIGDFVNGIGCEGIL
jgi:hypothetical protein